MQYKICIIIKVNGGDDDDGADDDDGFCDDDACADVLCVACASGGVWNDADDEFFAHRLWFHGDAQFASF